MTVRDRKYLRMNTIRAALETGDRSFKELLAIVYEANPSDSDKRALHFDLTGLKALGLIILKAGRYFSTETKTRYNNLAEYKLTMNHSRRLVLSSKDRQGFDSLNPEILVNRLVLEATKASVVSKLVRAIKYDTTIREDTDKYFLSHLKTGYYQEIYQNLLRYIELGKKYPKIQQILKYRSTTWDDWNEDEVVEVDPRDHVFVGPFGIPDALIYGLEPIGGIDHVRIVKYKDKTPVFKQVLDNPEIVREYITIKYDIAAQVYGLIGRIQNGVPLEGSCDACPLRHVKIEE